MDSVLSVLRDILGEADFYRRLTDNSDYTWDYGAMIEYLVGAVLLLVVVSSVFKFLMKLVK